MKISHDGSRFTHTYFRNNVGDTIKVTVWIDSSTNYPRGVTYYRYSISVRRYRYRKFNWVFNSNSSTDERYKEYITYQELYTAYHNHWNKLNPVRIFEEKRVGNDIIIRQDIKQLIADTKHKAF